MNHLEMALQTWRQERLQYEKSMKSVISQISKPIKFLPSPSFETRVQELRDYLKLSFNDEEQDSFNEVYVHHIAGTLNLSMIQLASKLVTEFGGSIKFWQNKIVDLASNVSYHPDLAMWEINRTFEHYMGLSPEYTSNLRRKKALARQYLQKLLNISKNIDKSKPCQEDLMKLDEIYKKLKKVEEKYYAFLQQIDNMPPSKQVQNISQRGKSLAKSNLFMFLKPKEEKMNTLVNYNFQIQKKRSSDKQSSLLKGKEYEEFDDIFNSLSYVTRSQRQSAYSEASNSFMPDRSREDKVIPMEEIRSQFDAYLKETAKEESNEGGQDSEIRYTFVWSKNNFYTFWGFPIKKPLQINYLNPLQEYASINYQICSQDQFDELNAEDVGSEFDSSSCESISNNSFVVADDVLDDEEQRDNITHYRVNVGFQRWVKESSQLAAYQVLCLYPEEKQLEYQLSAEGLGQEFINKLEGKSKLQIINIFQVQHKNYSKNRIQNLLKKGFKKIRKQGKIAYYTLDYKQDIEDRTSDRASEKQSGWVSDKVSEYVPNEPKTNPQKKYEINENSFSGQTHYQLRSRRIDFGVKESNSIQQLQDDDEETVLSEAVENDL